MTILKSFQLRIASLEAKLERKERFLQTRRKVTKTLKQNGDTEYAFGSYTVTITFEGRAFFGHKNGYEDYSGGLWLSADELIDADGTFEVPFDVCVALAAAGIKVSEEFWPDMEVLDERELPEG